MIFRLSQKLATKLKEKKLASLPLEENPYADWSAHLFTVNRTQYIIVSNTKSLYSAVMYAKGINDYNEFITCALRLIHDTLEDDDLPFIYRRFIAPSAATVQFAKSLNRSITGSMNELIKYGKMGLAEENLSPFEVGFKLNEVLMSAIAPDKSFAYGQPKEAFRAMLDRCGTDEAAEQPGAEDHQGNCREV